MDKKKEIYINQRKNIHEFNTEPYKILKLGNKDYEMRNLRALPLKIDVPPYFCCFDFCLRQKTYKAITHRFYSAQKTRHMSSFTEGIKPRGKSTFTIRLSGSLPFKVLTPLLSPHRAPATCTCNLYTLYILYYTILKMIRENH